MCSAAQHQDMLCSLDGTPLILHLERLLPVAWHEQLESGLGPKELCGQSCMRCLACSALEELAAADHVLLWRALKQQDELHMRAAPCAAQN